MTKEKLTTKKMVGYCLGDIFGGGAFTLVGMLYMNFLTDDILLSATAVGVMMFIGKIWDAIIDPFIGNISENASSKLGKRRVFFFAGIFHIGAAFISLWLPLTGLPKILKCIYFTLAYMLFATSFSLTMVPYHAMLPELTNNLKLRNRTVSIRSMISNASSMIAGLVPAMLVGKFGYLGMGICFAIFYTIPWIFVFFSTKGLDEVKEPNKDNKFNIFKGFVNNAKTVLKNKSFTKMLGLYLLSYTAMDIFMAIIVYYVKWYLGIYGIDKILGLGVYTFLLGVFMVFELLSIPGYTKLENVIGKKKSFMISTLLWSAATIVLFFMSSPANYATNKLLVIIPVALMGLGAGGVALLPWAMLPETMDVEELISGKRKDAVYSGFLTFIRQLSQALALLIVGLFLDAVDYGVLDVLGDAVEKASDLFKDGADPSLYLNAFALMSDKTKFGIKLFTSLAPAILLIASCIVSMTYPIDNNNYKLIQNEIKNRNTSKPEDLAELEKIVGKKNMRRVLKQQNKGSK